MLAWIITSAVLLVVCIGFEVYIIRMKRELRNIKQELRATTDKSYNRQISVDLQDKDLIAKVVMLEAGEKSPECQQAVAEVILNRLVRWGYSDYVPGVLYSENRFSGPLYRSPLPDITPSEEHYTAVEKAYSGPYIFPNDYVTYFGTTAWNESVWGELDGITFCYFS